MQKTETLTIELPIKLLAEVRVAVEAGDYPSDAAAVSDALLNWSAHRHGGAENISWLRQAVQEADEDDGPDLPMEDVMDRLQAEYRAHAAETVGRRQ